MTNRQISRRTLLQTTAFAAGALAAPAVLRAQNNPIRIGHQQDMTGFLAFYGYAFDNGARAAVEKINAEGGIAGRPVEYILADTESDVPTGLRQFRKLVESDGADFVLGATHSGINLATNPVAQELNTLVFPQGEASETTGEKGNRHVFRIRAHAGIQSRACVDFAVEELGKNWTFVLTDYSYGHSFYDELAPLVEARGGKVLDKIAVPVQTQDMIPFLARIPSETEVLFSVFTTADGIRYLRQTSEIGLASRVARLGPWGMVDGVSLEEIKQPLQDAYFLCHSQRWLDQVPEELRPFNASARERIGVRDDGAMAADTDRIIATSYYLAPWHALHLLKRSVETSGWSSKADNEALVTAMEGFQGEASADFPMGNFTMRAEDHQAFQDLWIEQVDDGKLVVKAEVERERLTFPPKIDVTSQDM